MRPGRKRLLGLLLAAIAILGVAEGASADSISPVGAAVGTEKDAAMPAAPTQSVRAPSRQGTWVARVLWSDRPSTGDQAAVRSPPGCSRRPHGAAPPPT